MSQINKIISKLEDHYDILDFLNKNYPSILKEWKLGTGPGTTEPSTNRTDDADVNNPGERNDYKRR